MDRAQHAEAGQKNTGEFFPFILAHLTHHFCRLFGEAPTTVILTCQRPTIRTLGNSCLDHPAKGNIAFVLPTPTHSKDIDVSRQSDKHDNAVNPTSLKSIIPQVFKYSSIRQVNKA